MEAGIVIPTCTVWRPTLECFKKVNELQGKERSLQMKESFYIPFIFIEVIAGLRMMMDYNRRFYKRHFNETKIHAQTYGLTSQALIFLS